MNTLLIAATVILAVALIAAIAHHVRVRREHAAQLKQEHDRGWNVGREYQLNLMTQPRQKNGRYKSKRVSAIVGTGGR